MSSGRKYSALPDLDAAPDIYETPELTDDTSTLPTSTAPRSASPASSYNDPGEKEATGIDRQRIDPDEARTHFLPPDADRDTRYTARVSSKRKSYYTSSRSRRQDVGGIEEPDILSDEDDESLERKLARLHREVAEVKNEYEKRKAGEKDGSIPSSHRENAPLDALGRVLDDINIVDGNVSNGAASRLAKKLGTATKTYESPAKSPTAEDVQPQEKPTYTMTYAPTYLQNSTLAKVSDFDARLTMLETVLGVEAIPLPTQDALPTKAVIPSLDALDKQISTLSSSTESSLDSVSRRVRQLTQDAEKLDEARRAAKTAQEELNYATPRRLRVATEETMSDKVVDHFEQTSKINALYGTLSTIESLSPLLPSLLDRLRSLRYIHADAATASQSLANVEARQEAMVGEIKDWRGGLEKVERAMVQGEQTMNGNTKMVERWVEELEDRMQKLG